MSDTGGIGSYMGIWTELDKFIEKNVLSYQWETGGALGIWSEWFFYSAFVF